jgi:hypothetical protein
MGIWRWYYVRRNNQRRAAIKAQGLTEEQVEKLGEEAAEADIAVDVINIIVSEKETDPPFDSFPGSS